MTNHAPDHSPTIGQPSMKLSYWEQRYLYFTLGVWAVFTIWLPLGIRIIAHQDYHQRISDPDASSTGTGNCAADTEVVQAACTADQITASLGGLILIAALTLVAVVLCLVPRAAHCAQEQVQRIIHIRHVIGVQAALVLAVITVLLAQTGPGTVAALTQVSMWIIPLAAWFVLLAFQSAAETTTGPRWPFSRLRNRLTPLIDRLDQRIERRRRRHR